VGEFTHEIARAAGVPEDRILELPNSTSWDGAEVTSTDLRDAPARVVSAGRLVPEKAFDVLILAFGEVFDEVPDVVLEIAGDGPQRSALEELTKRLGIDARVRFPGLLPPDRMPSFLAGASVAVLPSRVEEGFPRILVEAGLAGCALIGTDLGGIRDIVEPGRTGVLVPMNDHEVLAEALLWLLRDPSYARRLGTEARARSRDYLARREGALETVRTRLELLRCGAHLSAPGGGE
jgi:glycosyltransferase involved in cell wall biosynthesis